jgi:hypothetical protein
MRPVPVALAYTSSSGRHGQDGAAKLVNMYPEEIGETGKTKIALYAIDGMRRFSTLTGGGVRNLIAISESEAYAVCGRVIHRIDGTGTGTQVGGIVSDGLVTSARNRRAVPQVVWVCDGSVVYSEGGTFSTFTDPDLPPPNSVCQVSGYFVFTTADGRMFIAGPDDIGVDGLDVATASGNADGLLRGYGRGPDLLLFGERTVEAWGDTGGEFPFSRTTIMQIGGLSAASICDVDTTVAFVAHDGTVRILDGYTPQRVSNHEIERLIADDAHPTTIQGYGWTERGHRLVGLTGTNWTRVYDLTTGSWHERTSLNATRWRCGSVMQFGTRRIFGDSSLPRLYESDDDLSTEDDDRIDCYVQCPPVHGQRLPVSNFVADVVTGVGTVGGASHNSNPQLMLDYSDDGGATFGPVRHIPLGAAAQTQGKVKATRLGRIGNVGRTWRMRCTADVVKCIMSARMNDLEA